MHIRTYPPRSQVGYFSTHPLNQVRYSSSSLLRDLLHIQFYTPAQKIWNILKDLFLGLTLLIKTSFYGWKLGVVNDLNSFITRVYTVIISRNWSCGNSLEQNKSRGAIKARKDAILFHVNPIVTLAIDNTKIYNNSLIQGLMVINMRNGSGDLNSNPEWGCLHFA